MEGADGVATRIPLPQWRHGIGRILLKKLDEAVKIQAFPSLHITADEAFLGFICQWRSRWPTVRIALGERIPRALKRAADGGRRSAEECCGFGGRPAKDIAQQKHGALARRQLLDHGDESKLHSLAGRIARLRIRRVVSNTFEKLVRVR